MRSLLCFSWCPQVSCLVVIRVLFESLQLSIKCDFQSLVEPHGILFKHSVCLQLILVQDFIILESRPCNLVCMSFCNIYWNDVVKGWVLRVLAHSPYQWGYFIGKKGKKNPKEGTILLLSQPISRARFGCGFILLYLSKTQLYLMSLTFNFQ